MNFSKLLDLLTLPARGMIALLDKYDMEANKIAGSVFLAGIIAMACGLIAAAIYPAADVHSEEVKRGYKIAGAEAFEAGAAGGAEAAESAAPVDIATFLATADIAAGEKLVKRCTACHTFDKGGKNGVGPNNYGIVGAPVGHAAGFAYSEALLAHKGKKWDFETLSAFLENPKAFAPGNKMAFAGLRSPQDRANLMAYLNTLSDSKQPYPAPKPVEAAPAEAPAAAQAPVKEAVPAGESAE